MPEIYRFRTRIFPDAESLRRFVAGYESWPNWPKVGMNGSQTDAPSNSLEADGFWYHERQDEARREEREDSFEGEEDE